MKNWCHCTAFIYERMVVSNDWHMTCFFSVIQTVARTLKASRVGYSFFTTSCPTLCGPVDCAHQNPLSMGSPRQEYRSGLPCPSPGDLPHPGIEPMSAALKAGCLPSEPPGKPVRVLKWVSTSFSRGSSPL